MDYLDLMTQLRNATSALLNAEGLYPALDYGWEGEDTASDEYVGLAMWTTDAPFKASFTFWDRNSPPPLPSEGDEYFIGLEKIFSALWNFPEILSDQPCTVSNIGSLRTSLTMTINFGNIALPQLYGSTLPEIGFGIILSWLASV